MSLRPYIDMTVSTMLAIGGTFPKDVATALADRQRLADEARTYRYPSADDVADAMASAALAGRDPLDDDVRRLAVIMTFAGVTGNGIANRIEDAALRRVSDTMTEHASEIVATFKEAADAAGAKLTAAHRSLGDVELSNSTAVLNLGVDVASAWVDAKTHEKVVRMIDTAWTMLAHVTHLVSPQQPSALRMADVGIEVYEQLPYRCDPWQIVKAGAVIDLASFDNINARIARLNAEREQRTANAPTFEDSYRRQAGIGVPS